jgi:hypothetical protein
MGVKFPNGGKLQRRRRALQELRTETSDLLPQTLQSSPYARRKEATVELWRFVRRNDWRKVCTSRNSIGAASQFLDGKSRLPSALLGVVASAGRHVRLRESGSRIFFQFKRSVGLSIALSRYHHDITSALKPYAEAWSSSTWAWIVPVLLLIIVSFPPLIGHEIIILVVGMIWNLSIGFAIAAGGTFVGELATYFAFKYWFRARARKLEEKHVLYACLAIMMRQGGLLWLIVVR